MSVGYHILEYIYRDKPSYKDVYRDKHKYKGKLKVTYSFNLLGRLEIYLGIYAPEGRYPFMNLI